MEVTLEVSTKNRYDVLAQCLQSIAMQTVKPKKIIIYDDNDNPADLRKNHVFLNLFKTFERKGVEWEVLLSPRVGQLFNHQTTIDIAKTELIWRVDDDNIVEPDTLEKLLKTISKDDKIGAVAGCVLHPSVIFHPNSTSPKIEDSNFKYAIQFAKFDGEKEVDHLYSTFLFRKEAAKHGYCKQLSRVGHREETIFSYEMKRNGWRLMVNGDAVTWHWQSPGGIRSFSNPELWASDQKVFERKIKEWSVNFTKFKFIYLDNGLGDHFAFRTILPEIRERYKNHKIVIAAFNQEAFFDEPDVDVMDLDSGKILIGGDIERFSAYKMGFDNKGLSLVDCFRKIYL